MTTLEYEDDDQDEWDTLDNKTLLKTIKDDPQVQLQVGERVKVNDGQFKGCQGFITHIDDGFVSFNTEDSKPFKVLVRGFQVSKCFKLGENVTIIQGNRAGESGYITKIIQNGSGEDSHATVSMIKDTSQSDLTILINNLRIKTEVVFSSTNLQKGIINIDSYMAGDMIQYENLKKLGFVI